jgi:hypothetical protein
MANLNNFDIDNLSVNPNFDFIKTLLNKDGNDGADFDFVESPYLTSNIRCDYTDPVSYSNDFKNLTELSVLSLNVQSLSAKFSELKDLITLLSKTKSEPDVICLQEIWQISPHADFSLPGYSKLEFKIRSNNVQGGGVGIYVKKSYSYTISSIHSIFADRIFESIFVEIVHKKSKSSLDLSTDPTLIIPTSPSLNNSLSH